MPYFLFHWDEETENYLAQHGIDPAEFEQVVSDPEETGKSNTSSRPIASGYVNGRLILCVYELVDDIHVYPVTAYEIES